VLVFMAHQLFLMQNAFCFVGISFEYSTYIIFICKYVLDFLNVKYLLVQKSPARGISFERKFVNKQSKAAVSHSFDSPSGIV
jgi:hypothetical protein